MNPPAATARGRDDARAGAWASMAAAAAPAAVRNVFTVDVEDWYHLKVEAPGTWDAHENRVEVGTRIVLDLLARHGVRGTFFVLGYAADRNRDLVREISAAGHEIACHGYWHQYVYRQTAAEFEEDLKRSLGLLRDLTGQPIHGFRASSFSVSAKTPWFWEALVRHGVTYDSSTFPVKNFLYGGLATRPEPHLMPGLDLVEIPVVPTTLAGVNIPFSGGFYLRFHPRGFLDRAARRLNRNGHPVIYYVHPWEYDLAQPRMALNALWRFFRYHRLSAMAPVTDALLARGRFQTMSELADAVRAGNEGAPVAPSGPRRMPDAPR